MRLLFLISQSGFLLFLLLPWLPWLVLPKLYWIIVVSCCCSQSLSSVCLFATPWIAVYQVSLSSTISWSLCKLMPIELVMPSNYLVLCHPFSSCPQSFQASGSFQMSHLFLLDSQSIGASALTSALPMNIQGWFSLRMTGLISLQSKEFLRVFSNTIVGKHQFFGTQTSLWSNSQIHTWLPRKHIALTRWTLVSKVMSLLFNILSRLVIAFLPRNKHLNCMAPVKIPSDFEVQENKICYCFPNYLP